MRIQQLQYIIKIVECGSMNEAAKQLFITQPSLSNAVKELEQEMGITIFIRNSKGITLTKDGVEFLSYARQIIEQTALLEDRYKNHNTSRELFSVSSQHYAFVVNAFVSLLKRADMTQYELFLRETRTWEIIDDVKNFRSEIGVLFINDYNRDVLTKLFEENHLTVSTLFKTTPHIFISKSNPLANKTSLTIDDLLDFPYLSYDQGIHNSFYFSEEMMAHIPHSKSIVVSDRATLFNLMIGLNGYTVASGILNTNLNGDQIVAIPLDVPDVIEIVFIKHEKANLSKMGERFIDYLLEEINFNH
ncbi:TPA: LysR family transcriptional regulator [Streptococcus equi subsp. zooepidemicus]|uniref:LysR family transcriptional regulator n=1 Tax=Streptococcus equi subsp. equi TaxID=148942 RepID=A0A380JRA1_9STRE|nr:LysR family transcriptional regulator [Streptococcus equi]KIS10910.1 LysR family transcriptional regulator [Streptococcus equi subsp. zooepidemicus Sz57]MCD3413343.1 LysR family transcriptional regulator [Streptococcus equi subsp. zooepidemicus]MCD3430822.1 LysR family transcriptional regulator [Streptococcus equi subsp. zooepidemicus]MCD3437433.1 LysR family transcriptional regulator [Streptococcus equi subsp. zooepidemicus]MDI6043467.1 LysR family transcriptional regulator [Streptococcus 